MATINQLSAVDAVTSGQQIPLYDPPNGDARKASVSQVQDYMQANLNFDDDFFNDFVHQQITADAVLGYSFALVEDSNHNFIILIAAGTHPSININVPGTGTSSPATPANGQEVIVFSTEIITTVTVLTYSPTTILGAPTTLAANGYFKLKYDAVTNKWYRIG